MPKGVFTRKRKGRMKPCLYCGTGFYVAPCQDVGGSLPERKYCSTKCDKTDKFHNGRELERFWAKVDKSAGPDACWPWMGARVPAGGYGRFKWKRLIASHRLAWILTHGEIESKEIDVMHTCDNPPCCNPKHLKIGTALDNMKDCIAKGRRRHKYMPIDQLLYPQNSRRLKRAS